MATGARIAAALELGRRASLEIRHPGERVRGPRDVFDRMEPRLRDLPQEEFHAILLSARHSVIQEVFITRAVGVGRSAWDVAFSPDAAQEYLYDVDAGNQKVWTLRRDSLEVLGRFGQGGRWAGQFYGAHSVATDSLGNLFVGETYEGKRVQKFVYQGLGVQSGQ